MCAHRRPRRKQFFGHYKTRKITFFATAILAWLSHTNPTLRSQLGRKLSIVAGYKVRVGARQMAFVSSDEFAHLMTERIALVIQFYPIKLQHN